MKILNIITAFLSILLFASCGKDKKEVRIDSDIIVNLRVENEEIILGCRTEKEYHCSNYAISLNKSSTKETITINFDKIAEPEYCLRRFGPASTDINLGRLEQGTYPLKLKLRRKTTEAELNVGNTVSFKETKSGNVKIE